MLNNNNYNYSLNKRHFNLHINLLKSLHSIRPIKNNVTLCSSFNSCRYFSISLSNQNNIAASNDSTLVNTLASSPSNRPTLNPSHSSTTVVDSESTSVEYVSIKLF